MQLIYRGVKYNEKNPNLSVATTPSNSKEIVYRGNCLKATSNPKFPWLSYIKQIFQQSKSTRILDPISFWYDRRRKFLNHCWLSDDVERLNRAWDLTRERERAKAIASKPKTKLKYRGVTYYR
ncbi:MAG: DUF4278 domain-containing protein [Pleurocapsa sp. MO_226.B13]|nr:DUF4278 domain-containing protein [Pleurocapsa sp. MO_226.B13]